MKIAAIDFETTGLNYHIAAPLEVQPRAIEFGGVAVDEHGDELSSLAQLIHPGQEISAEITKITGLTNEDLSSAPTIIGAWPPIGTFFEGVDVMVAHNLPFDAFVLANELRRVREYAAPHQPEELRSAMTWRWPRRMLCTVELFEPIWGRRPRLIELYAEVCGREYEQTHRALDDVRALIQIILAVGIPEILSHARPSSELLPPEYDL